MSSAAINVVAQAVAQVIIYVSVLICLYGLMAAFLHGVFVAALLHGHPRAFGLHTFVVPTQFGM